MNETVITRIAEFLFGRKYYANIINVRGTEKCEINCHIFHTKAEANKHRDDIATTYSFMYIETISFRSRVDYPKAQRG